MSGGGDRAVVFVESNTSGTGALFVRTAREMGFRPVLLSADPGRYAFVRAPGAPEVVPVAEMGEEALYAAIRAAAGPGGIAGVTSSSEYWIATAAALAARCGLPGPDAARVRAARDKGWQRRALAAGGMAVPAFRAVARADEAAQAAAEIGCPVVVKPVAGSGSVGVRACDTPAAAAAHAAALLAGGGPVLVEELVEGDEYSVEVFSGQVVGITRKHLGTPPWFVEAGHDYPACVPDAVAGALAGASLRGTELLGLGWGPLHWELRVRDGVALPMEVNPRLAGGFIPELVRHAQGVDLVRETLRLVVGLPPALAPRRHRHASIRFVMAPGEGRLAGVDGMDAARARPGVVSVELYRAPGEALSLDGSFRDRIGHVVACADDAGEAAAAAGEALAAVRVRVDAPAGARAA